MTRAAAGGAVVAAALCSVLWAQLCMAQPERLIRYDDHPIVSQQTTMMGTDVEILVATHDREPALSAIGEAFTEMRRIEALMTDWDDDSVVSAINVQAGIRPIGVSVELFRLLEEAKRLSVATHGKFDVTYAGAGKLWDFRHPVVPDASLIARAIERVDYRRLILDGERSTAMLAARGMRIGLGGIAKGYAVDRAVQIMQQAGFEEFAVNAGGDLAVRGSRTDDGDLWWVGIRHPRRSDELAAILPIKDLAVATSGDYERYFEIDGRRYCHILDPATGYPVQTTQSVTVMAPRTYEADALATGVFVLGAAKGMALIEGLGNVEGMIIDADGEMHVSSGLRLK